MPARSVCSGVQPRSARIRSLEATNCGGSPDAGGGQGDVDEGVELGSAHRVVVPQARVGVDHEPPEGLDVAGAQGGGTGPDPGVLGHDDVPGAAQLDVGQPGAVLGEQLAGDVAQRAQLRGDVPEPAEGGFALAARSQCSGSSRSCCAAVSGVMSRWGWPSSS